MKSKSMDQMVVGFGAEDYGTALHCPVCGFATDDGGGWGSGGNYVHPVAVSVNAGGDTTLIDRDGVHQGHEESKGRGVWIALRFVCENCDHQFALTFHFYKGRTFITHRVGSKVPCDVDPETGTMFPFPAASMTIWRD